MAKQTRDTLITRVSPLGREPTDIALSAGTIVATGADTHNTARDPRIIGAGDPTTLLGLVDIHAYPRQPGGENVEIVFIGTRTAAVGGYTAVHTIANTTLMQNTIAIVNQALRPGEEAGWVEVCPIGAAIKGLEGKRLASLDSITRLRSKARVFSDDGECAPDLVLMHRVLEYVRGFGNIIAQYSQGPAFTEGAQMNESTLSGELDLSGWPVVAEKAITAHDILLARRVGSCLHAYHLLTAGSVDLVRWDRAQGVDITAEATSHHLLLTEQLVATYDLTYRVNPPLRWAENVEAVREGLADGTIDYTDTDHAPHPLEMKDCEWRTGALGMTGLGTALSIIIEMMVNADCMDWADIARVISTVPAQIGRVTSQGQGPVVGGPTHATLADATVRVTVDPARQWTRSANCPFCNMGLSGQVRYTIYNGVLTVADATPIAKKDR